MGKTRVFVVLAACVAWACGDSDGGSAGCATAADCEGAQRCVNGRCMAPEEDASLDAARDGGPDASRDAGFDAEGCAGESPSVTALAPARGARTGSVHAPAAFQVLRPRFSWAPAAGAETYELQVDDSCAAASGCDFPSPEVDARALTDTSHRPETDLPVSRTAPVGQRYYWRVRACAGTCCGPWTPTRYLDVGRLPGDLNGDGYADLAVGARLQGPDDQGQVFVYFGGPSGGVPQTPSVSLAAPTLEGMPGPWKFGSSVATAGDLNGDGYADLAVGAEAYGSDGQGAVFVYWGGVDGPAPAPDLTLLNPGDADQARDGRFGTSVANGGDLDGDGYADLVVGARWQAAPEGNEGNVFVYLGGPAGVAAAPDAVLDNPRDEIGGNFGWVVATDGDFDGDGYVDLVVAAYKQDRPGAPDAGWAFVYRGGGGSLPVEPTLEIPNPAAEDAQAAGGLFGVSLASAGDLDGDGLADLAVGASFQFDPVAEVADVGVVYLFFSEAGTGLGAAAQAIVAPEAQPNARFGQSLTTGGDFDGDGLVDLAVGANLWDVDPAGGNEGRVFVYLGARESYGAGLPTVAPSVVLDDPGDGVRAGSNFGYAAAANDFDGDGFADLAVGAHRQDAPEPNEGNVFVYLGGPAVLPRGPSTVLDNPANEVGAFFGQSLASARLLPVGVCGTPGGSPWGVVAGPFTSSFASSFLGSRTRSRSRPPRPWAPL